MLKQEALKFYHSGRQRSDPKVIKRTENEGPKRTILLLGSSVKGLKTSENKAKTHVSVCERGVGGKQKPMYSRSMRSQSQLSNPDRQMPTARPSYPQNGQKCTTQFQRAMEATDTTATANTVMP